jgi:hypothetical protein
MTISHDPLGARSAVLHWLLGLLLVVGLAQFWPADATRTLASTSCPLGLLDEVEELPREVGPGELRIFVIGASETMGFPYEPALHASYGTLLGDGLAALWPERQVVVRVVASTALDSESFAELATKLVAWRPHVLCVTLGNNELGARIAGGRALLPDSMVAEFADRMTRTREVFGSLPWPKDDVRERRVAEDTGEQLPKRVWQARPGVPAFGGLPVAARDQELLVARLRANLRSIGEAARAAGSRLALCIAAHNLAGNWPYGMTQRDAEIDRWILRLQRGAADDAVRSAIDAALRRSPSRADLHHANGLLQLHAHEPGARADLERGRDLDEAPLHTTGPVRAAIRAEAAALGAACIDFDEALLDERGVPAPALFLDHAHLDEEGHLRAAVHLAERLAAEGLIPALPSEWKDAFHAAARERGKSVSKASRQRARLRMAWNDGVLHMLCGNFRDALFLLRGAMTELARKDLGAFGQEQVREAAPIFLYCLFSLVDRVAENLVPSRQQELLRRLHAFVAEGRSPDPLIDDVLR